MIIFTHCVSWNHNHIVVISLCNPNGDFQFTYFSSQPSPLLFSHFGGNFHPAPFVPAIWIAKVVTQKGKHFLFFRNMHDYSLMHVVQFTHLKEGNIKLVSSDFSFVNTMFHNIPIFEMNESKRIKKDRAYINHPNLNYCYCNSNRNVKNKFQFNYNHHCGQPLFHASCHLRYWLRIYDVFWMSRIIWETRDEITAMSHESILSYSDIIMYYNWKQRWHQKLCYCSF